MTELIEKSTGEVLGPVEEVVVPGVSQDDEFQLPWSWIPTDLVEDRSEVGSVGLHPEAKIPGPKFFDHLKRQMWMKLS